MRIKVKAIILAVMLISMTGCASNTNEINKETNKLGIKEDGIVSIKEASVVRRKIDEALYGESDNWKARYILNGYIEHKADDDGAVDLDVNCEYELIITYKGKLEELNEMRTLEVEQKESWGSKSIPDIPLESVEFRYQGTPSLTTLFNINDNKEIKITVIWDGANGSEEEMILQ